MTKKRGTYPKSYSQWLESSLESNSGLFFLHYAISLYTKHKVEKWEVNILANYLVKLTNAEAQSVL